MKNSLQKIKEEIYNRLDELIDDVGAERCSVIFSATISCLLFIIIFYRLGLYPFGDRTLLYADGDQYAAFSLALTDIISTNETPYYTFHSVLGSAYLPTIAYYGMSPFNLIMFFYKNNLIVGWHLISCIKYMAASVSFCVLLNALQTDFFFLLAKSEKSVVQNENIIRMTPSAVFETATFSAAYAFMGYTVFFAWNLSWMDGVILLPLMTLGLLRMVKNKDFTLYVISIALALISNFYIGYMICIASIIFYAFYLFCAERNIVENLKDTVGIYTFASVIGAGLSGFVTVTTILSLPENRKNTVRDIYENMRGAFRFSDFFSMLFTGRTDIQSDNLPMIFSGLIPVVLIVIFFFNNSIKMNKKMCVMAILALFFFSFWNSTFNMLWHGTSENHWFNFRYSFILSFILLIIAFYQIRQLYGSQLNFRHVAVFIAFFFFWSLNDALGYFFAKNIMYDVIQLIVGIAIARRLVLKESKGGDELMLSLALCMMMVGGIYMNAISVLGNDVKESISASYFTEESRRVAVAIAQIPEKGFFRSDKTFQLLRNDAVLFGYNGVTNYTSTENVALEEILREYGVQHDWKYGIYNVNAPTATDALLGMKYILSDVPLEYKGYRKIADKGGGVSL